MTSGTAAKSLKDQNRRRLWLTIGLNLGVYYAFSHLNTNSSAGWTGLFGATTNLLPLGLALIVTSVANGLLSADMKAQLVFLRWSHALPGHRAFSKLAPSDPRIDLDRLKASLGNHLPQEPVAENRAWYQIFKEVEAAPEVEHIHREFLFMRDYAGLSALFLVGFGGAALFLFPSWRSSFAYCLALLLQFIVVRHAAATYGARFVCTVLAVKSAKLAGSGSPSLKVL